MKNSRTPIHVFAVVLACFSWSSISQAQVGGNTGNQQDSGTTNNAGTAANGGGTDLTEPDVSAFDEIQRGGALGSAAASGFGPAATGNTGGANAFGGGGFGGFGGLGGLGGLFGGGGFGGSQSTTPTIRTRLRSAIQVAPMAPQRVQANANQRIVQLPGRQGLQNVRVDVIGRTAVIEGTATSDRDRRMAELLMRLEPGVSSVQNNVRVNAR
jgi:hypothetical protein